MIRNLDLYLQAFFQAHLATGNLLNTWSRFLDAITYFHATSYLSRILARFVLMELLSIGFSANSSILHRFVHLPTRYLEHHLPTEDWISQLYAPGKSDLFATTKLLIPVNQLSSLNNISPRRTFYNYDLFHFTHLISD